MVGTREVFWPFGFSTICLIAHMKRIIMMCHVTLLKVLHNDYFIFFKSIYITHRSCDKILFLCDGLGEWDLWLLVYLWAIKSWDISRQLLWLPSKGSIFVWDDEKILHIVSVFLDILNLTLLVCFRPDQRSCFYFIFILRVSAMILLVD